MTQKYVYGLKYGKIHLYLRKLYYKDIIKRCFCDCDSILDIACGRGQFVTVAKEWGFHAKGLDKDPSQNPDFVGDFRTQVPGSYDGVFTGQFIEHTNPIELMETITRYYSPKVIVIATDKMNRRFWDDPTHVRPYTVKSIQRLMLMFDYEPFDYQNIYFLPNFWVAGKKRDFVADSIS